MVPVGALLAGYLVDKIGRLNTIKVGAIPYMIGWVLIATAQNLPMLLLGRFFTGFALGNAVLVKVKYDHIWQKVLIKLKFFNMSRTPLHIYLTPLINNLP